MVKRGCKADPERPSEQAAERRYGNGACSPVRPFGLKPNWLFVAVG